MSDPTPQAAQPPAQPPPPDDAATAAHDELVNALEQALEQVEGKGPAQATAATVAVPGWLTAIIRSAVGVFGPALIAALKRLLDTLGPSQMPSGPQVPPPA